MISHKGVFLPLSRLNEEQYAAATSDDLQNLIIASAGTGKTSTIVGRIGHLLNAGVKPQEILLLTFKTKQPQRWLLVWLSILEKMWQLK